MNCVYMGLIVTSEIAVCIYTGGGLHLGALLGTPESESALHIYVIATQKPFSVLVHRGGGGGGGVEGIFF